MIPNKVFDMYIEISQLYADESHLIFDFTSNNNVLGICLDLQISKGLTKPLYLPFRYKGYKINVKNRIK